jgi:hypothetical protein
MGLLDQLPSLRCLSKLANLRAARKTLSDARTATYVTLSTGSGPIFSSGYTLGCDDAFENL